ncbi:PhnD/SsuA/transferrin family substrate-binding protein [Desulfosarcina cetonica]|uniref:PhnD/SsuA/transferrin family substrate-binding protein n=1 Tax=Desulfosarcina cetonica TaxID=90730 RepID=UPI0006D182C5|nr:PhnD/SsuA/transferrin family substrate-binding protein [Desulfosarcina cetonica]
MRRVFFILMVVFVTGFKPAHAETIRFIPLPMQNRETVFGQFKPMTDYLEQRLEVKIVYDYCDSYADVLERFRQSRVDLAYLGPLPYVELRATFAHAEPIVRFCESSGRAEYTCALVSFMDNVFDPQSAHHRRIALTQPFSTCSYLSTSRLMHWMGSNIEQNLYRYLKKHDEVALSVIRGDFDAGGLKTAIACKYAHMGLNIVAETLPLPGFALVGNTRTGAATDRRDP